MPKTLKNTPHSLLRLPQMTPHLLSLQMRPQESYLKGENALNTTLYAHYDNMHAQKAHATTHLSRDKVHETLGRFSKRTDLPNGRHDRS